MSTRTHEKRFRKRPGRSSNGSHRTNGASPSPQELNLDQEGTYPFVDHSFADMLKGAAGPLQTENAAEPAAGMSH